MAERSDFFISADELAGRLDSAAPKCIDASWYLPAMERDGMAEFAEARIPGAVFFNIDTIADTSSGLPHMLPAPEVFGKAMGELGISETDEIVVYDGPGMFSAARAWWTLRVMGAANVRILEGGFDRWKEAGHAVETGAAKDPAPAVFKPAFDAGKVWGFETMLANIRRGDSLVLDARPFARFTGETAEPRPGLASGHIPGSRSLAATDVVRDGFLLSKDELSQKLREVAADKAAHIVTSCGSGVTAAILSLSLEVCGYENHALYDGSWSEWGGREDAPVARWA